MQCPLCGHKSFARPNPIVVEDGPGRRVLSQRRVCSNPTCGHCFTADIIMDALPPEPPKAA